MNNFLFNFIELVLFFNFNEKKGLNNQIMSHKYGLVSIGSRLILFLVLAVIGVLSVFLFALNVTAHNNLFNDGFESEDEFGNWDSADNKWDVIFNEEGAHSGEGRAKVKGNTQEGGEILLKSLSTEGHENVVIDFWYKSDSLEEDDEDSVELQWSADGGDSWGTVYVINSENDFDDWTHAEDIELSSGADDNSNFKFRFVANLNSGSTDDVSIDDVSVTADDDELGKISGYKWEDLDGDGELDEGEPLLNDWTIWLDGDSYAVTGDDEKSWPDGYYEFDNLEPNEEYVVCEERELSEDNDSWTQTYPNSNIGEDNDYYDYVYEDCNNDFEISDSLARYGYIFDVDGDDLQNVNFGNRLTEITVKKFNDKNASGEWDKDEPFLSGWNFCLYKITYGDETVYELVPPCQTTDNQGEVSWTGLEEGEYRLDEEERENWFHTTTGEDGILDFEFEDGIQTYYFGNTNNTIRIQKFWDKNRNTERDGYWTEEEESEFVYTEPVLENWQFCLDKWNSEAEEWELIECKNTDSDGWVWWTDLGEGDYKAVETIKENWFSTNFEGGIWEWIEIENGEGEQVAYFGNDIAIIYGHKFYDINRNNEQDYWEEGLLEPNIRNWQICLYRIEDSEEVPLGCKFTNEDGLVSWEGLIPGSYRVIEELRGGWMIPNGSELFGESPHIRNVELEDWGDEATVDFGNWIEDGNPPVSQFDESREHEVINTEMISLELTGRSYDQESGIKEADMTIYKLGGPESVQEYPAQSFFDVFTELSCPPEDRPIETELVALSLVSVDPITVSWNRNWVPPSSGTYCFEVKSKDYANNSEQTAWAGPLAYVPVAQVMEEEVGSVAETSFTVEWVTDKPATSRVVYDTVSHPVLGEAPNYGYAFSTVEQDLDPKVIDHSVVVSGLTAGTTYYYRTVSAASPESVGNEGSTSTQSLPSNNSGGGSGGGMGVVIDGPSITSTPTSSPVSTPSSGQSSQGGIVSETSTPTGSPGTVQGSASESTDSQVSPAQELNSQNELITPESVSPPVSPNTKTEEPNDNNQNMTASLLGLLLGSVSLWWMVVLVVATVLAAYANRKRKGK